MMIPNRTTNLRHLFPLVAILFAAMSLSAETPAPLELKIHHAAASVGNLDRAIKWYTEKLGFKVVLRQKIDADREIAWLTMPGFRVDLLQVKGSLPHPQVADHMQVQGWGHIVFSVASVDRTYAALKARGVVLPEAPTTNAALHIRTSHFPDSEGNWLEIYEDLPATSK